MISSCSCLISARHWATDLGMNTFRLLVSVFGVFKTRTVLLFFLWLGKIKRISFESNASSARLDTRSTSLFTRTYARFSATASSEISTQSHVSPRISPIRSVAVNARWNAIFSILLSQASIACINISAVQISRSCFLAFGTVASVVGFFFIRSHFTACRKQLLRILWISFTVDSVIVSVPWGFRVLMTAGIFSSSL